MSDDFAPVREMTERGSSVKLSTTAKGDPVVEVKVYAGDSPADVRSAYDLAESIFQRALREFRIGAGAAS